MDEKQLNRALPNLTDDNEAWMAIDHLLTESRNHATLVALDVAGRVRIGRGNVDTLRQLGIFTGHSIRGGEGR